MNMGYESFGETKEKSKFARRLGLIGATNIGLGAMLGGGIYVISGTAAGMIGPALVFAYCATGLITVFTAINYAELASSIPKQGGGYTFAHDTFGGFPGFLTGWFLLIGNIIACALYALAVAHTLAVFLPLDVATIAVIIILLTWLTNIVSIKGVSGVLGLLNIAQSFVLLFFVVAGLWFVNPQNLDPWVRYGPEFNSAVDAFMATVAFVYISFVGFELITTASEEIKEPAKNIPRAIMLTLFIATLIYMGAALVIVGVVPSGPGSAISESHTPISDVYGIMFGPWAFYLGLAGMAASNYAALNATFLASARVVYSMGRDRYLPSFLDRVNERTKTPIPALMFTLLAVSLFASTGNVNLVASLSDFGYLIGLAIVNASVIKLRRSGLSVPGTFKSRYYPLVPILGVTTCLLLVPFLQFEFLIIGVVLSIIGFIIYLGYSRSRNENYRRTLKSPIQLDLLQEKK